MNKKDVPDCHELFLNYMKNFALAPQYSKKEFAHWCLPTTNVIYSYVVEDKESKKITDFASFYHLPSSVIGNKEYKNLKAAYLFYYAVSKTDLTILIDDILVLARDEGFDVLNCLDILDNRSFRDELKFSKGDGHLYYYLYNFASPQLNPQDVALVML